MNYSGVPPKGTGAVPLREGRWLFLLVDIFLLAIIVAAIVFFLLLSGSDGAYDGEVETRTVTYAVEFAGVQAELLAALSVGDTVVDAETGSVIGVVEAVDSRPYEVYTDVPTAEIDELLNSHVVTKVTYPESYHTVTVTLRLDAEYRAGLGYASGDCRLAVGREYTMQFPAFSAKGQMVSLAE